MSTSNSLECVVSEREYLSGSAKYKGRETKEEEIRGSGHRLPRISLG